MSPGLLSTCTNPCCPTSVRVALGSASAVSPRCSSSRPPSWRDSLDPCTASCRSPSVASSSPTGTASSPASTPVPTRTRWSTGGRCRGTTTSVWSSKRRSASRSAFCPEQSWELLSPAARNRLVHWLHGIFEHDPNPNNWQFFRVLVALGLERVGAAFDRSKVAASLDLLDSYRVGRHWYADGALANVDYYVPFAFHTYGLMYAAANDLGLGDDVRAAAYRERAATFASEAQHWFAPDGAAVPFGRSLTYRFAMSSFWGALAWADVESDLAWGAVRGSRDAQPALVGRAPDQRPRRCAVDRLHLRQSSPLRDVQFRRFAVLVHEGVRFARCARRPPVLDQRRATARTAACTGHDRRRRPGDHPRHGARRAPERSPGGCPRLPGAVRRQVPQVRVFLGVRIQR